MLLKRAKAKLILLVLASLVGLCAFVGCGQHDYKAEADEQVYGIIDRKWKDEFGAKANYRVSDVAPSPNDIEVDKSIPPGSVLSLPRAVAIATAHNRDYHLQKEMLYTMALDLRLARHQFETQFFAKPKFQDAKVDGDRVRTVGGGISPRLNPDKLGQDMPVEMPGPEESRRNLAEGGTWRPDQIAIEPGFGFNQMLMEGTVIGANLAIAWSRLLTGPWKGERFFQVLGLQVTQPLLRGRDRQVVMENLTQAERDALYQVRLFNRFRKTFVVLVITQYYQTLQLLDVAENAQQNCEVLTWLCERVEKLVEVGRLPEEELERLRQEILQARDAYYQADKEYRMMLDWFKITLGVPTTTEFQLDEGELDALRAVQMSYPDFSEAEAIETALSRRLDLANSADAVADAKRKVAVAADSLGADLNLVVDAHAPLHDLRSDNKIELGDLLMATLEMDLPLDRVAEQNVFRKALLILNQRQRDYELAQDTLRLEVRQAYRDLTEAAERYKVSSEGLKLAQKRFENTLLLMQYGRASSRRVLDAQNAFLDAQNAASEAAVGFAVATLNFYRDTGILQVRSDGMWERGLTEARRPAEVQGQAAAAETAPRTAYRRIK
jgi:outer membrane protein TolC